MTTTYFYIDDWNDEVLPCLPTLSGWAEWLAADIKAEWGREGPIADGAEFNCGRLTDLGTVGVTQGEDGGWTVDPAVAIPEGTTSFFRRDHLLDSGWDAEFCGNTIEDALTDWEGDTFLACVKDEPTVRVRFEASPPRLVVLGEVN